MRRASFSQLLLLPLLLPAAVHAQPEPQAVEVARRSMEAMGGQDAFRSVRLLTFDWAVERDGETVVRYRHWWDRHSGDYRLEGKTREGEDLKVLFNLGTRQGQVWLDGEEVRGEAAEEHLSNAYGRHINDSYWLLMPWKWFDPGVVLSYEGERSLEGRRFDVVRLEFGDGIGLTSNDRYWGWVARDSGLMERWEYVLQDEAGAPGSGDASGWVWVDWQETAAGIKLSTAKRRVGAEGDVAITFPAVSAESSVDESTLRAIFSPE